MNSIPFIFLKLLSYLCIRSLIFYRFDTKEVGCPHIRFLKASPNAHKHIHGGSPHIMSCSVPRVYILFNFGDLSRSEALYICSHKNHVPKNDGAKIQKINQILSYLSFFLCVDSSKFSFSMFLTYLLTPKRVYIFRL